MTETVQDYLKAIWMLDRSGSVTTSALAERLGVTAASATAMIKRLASVGLVRHEPYHGVALTDAGTQAALEVIRHHRLLEQYLAETLGVPIDAVHDEADRLEHVISEKLEARIDEQLGFPTHDPHGDPIPDPEGVLTPRHLDNLLTCPMGTPLKVTRIADQDPAFLHFIEENDLKPGQPVQVVTRDTAADSVLLRSGDRRLTIGTRAASKLLVEVA